MVNDEERELITVINSLGIIEYKHGSTSEEYKKCLEDLQSLLNNYFYGRGIIKNTDNMNFFNNLNPTNATYLVNYIFSRNKIYLTMYEISSKM